MNDTTSGFTIPIAILLAAIMGFAIQRGGTCTVAAVEEVLAHRKASRLWALIETAIWVLGGLLLGNAIGLSGLMPAGYRIGAWTILGAAMLGLGAAVNRACVFGTVARLGNGEWVYLVTPVGFFFGCLLMQGGLRLDVNPSKLSETSTILTAPRSVVLAILAWMAWRIVSPLWSSARLSVNQGSRAASLVANLGRRIWAPHAATLVIGVTFIILLWLVGAWTYTDFLAEWARNGMAGMPVRGVFLIALFAGAIGGGWTSGQIRHVPIHLPGVLRCAGGGLLMGAGSSSIPGGNDGLILTGMPLLWPYAWVSFAIMCVVIAGYLSVFSRSD